MHTVSFPFPGLKAALLALALVAPPALSQESEEGRLPLDELRTFADVFNQIRLGYVEEVDDSTLLEYAIQGMLMNLDPHSAYLSKDAFEDLQTNTSGEFSGLGLEVGMEDGYVKIIAPIDGSPAAEAGLMTGDVILRLDDKPVKGMSLNEAIELMRGPKGSPIKLQIGRPGDPQPFDLTLTRDTITVASVRERFLEPGFGYIRVAQFQNRTGQDVGDALKRLLDKEELKGLVLDLRNNPGGILGASVDVAGLFLDGELVVYTEGRLTNSDMRYSADPGDASDGTPIVVLINGGSASASEIVAGALQDHKRAVIMGTASFGKGSVQTVMPISESRAVKLTTALYFTPGGRSIQAAGIAPDITVERAQVTAYDTSRQLSEADLARRLENVNGDKPRAPQVSDGLLGTDNQLYEALTLLKGVHILGMRERGPTAKVPADSSGG
ncbi:S41 family peptidase [Haliea sp. E1-2-M8]|uniref:S41 family peptidase n=1 Tax=Haliea sp. E1-2-M8 TaxID=3064706 RepID=UPI0027221992|nr:S41 family peptidase [Haliea sp. E1-2-M8]MDO8860918.1 S41 family peptidase [Haliea sp. E1-2-M8]